MCRRSFRDARSDTRVFSLSQSIISAYRQEVQLTVLGAGDEAARRVDCRQALHRRPRAIRKTSEIDIVQMALAVYFNDQQLAAATSSTVQVVFDRELVVPGATARLSLVSHGR